MEKVLITGCAGFIGSHTAEKLLSEGYRVIGIDCFTDYYSRKQKEKNIKSLVNNKNFRMIEGDLNEINLKDILSEVAYVFHVAAQPGVRQSFEMFSVYVKNNILATQRLLECTKDSRIKKFIYSSSSSVYGNTKQLPIKETAPLRPISPYGVTKLAGENLCYAYQKNYNIPLIILRYFTVYGPRQRPDMAFHNFIKSIFKERYIEIYGDGEQTRDFTYITDVVNANILAMKSGITGAFNIGGNKSISINDVIKIMERLIGKKARIRYIDAEKGDVLHTKADTNKANNYLDYRPRISIEDGLKKEIDWILLEHKIH